jgi:hypothetical protein
MMEFLTSQLIFVAALSQTVVGISDTLLSVSTCLPGSPLTAFPYCDSLYNTSQVCGSFNKQDQQNCICNQAYLDSITGCENEENLCYMDNAVDSSWLSTLAEWHTICDTYITFSPTTIPLSTLTTTWSQGDCEEMITACASALASIDKCSTDQSDITSLSSCLCTPDIMSWDYTCSYLGNISCYETGATLSELPEYSLCENFAEVIGSGISSAAVITVSIPPSSTVTSNPSPGNTLSTAPTPTSTASSKSAASPVSGSSNWGSLLTVFLLVALL